MNIAKTYGKIVAGLDNLEKTPMEFLEIAKNDQ